MLDFRIDTFLEVCRFMNYTRAAQELNLTQPAVSQHIRWLEEQYQAKLFCYENKQLSLTKSGELLRSAAITMKQDETYLRRKIRQIRQTENDLSFGVTPTVGMYLIPGPLAEYQKKYPDAQIAALTQWWVAAGNLLPKDTFEVWDGLGHAGEGETSIAYYLFPDWCEPEYATCVIPNLPSEVEIKWDFSELTDTAQTGDATKGTAEKGKKMNDVIVEHVVKTLKELDATGWKYRPEK